MLKVASIFTDNMVLQRDKNISVWGLDDKDRKVTVSINGASAHAKADESGKWIVTLPPMSAGGEYEMSVTDGFNTFTYKGVMIGEVWFCGGQSNMELELQNEAHGKDVLKELDESCNVRFYYTQKRGYIDEMFYADEANTCWAKAGPESSKAWSAVGFYFARKLASELGVTVGLIGCNWGGTSASAWVDRKTLESDSDLRSYIDEYDEKLSGKPLSEQLAEYRAYEKYDAEWYQKSLQVYKEQPDISWDDLQEKIGKNQWPGPMCEFNPFRPTGLFETMVMRVCPYTIKGFLYYQGESDDHKPDSYYKLLTALIRLWREKWGDDELPFIITQLPMFKYKHDPDYKHWCKIRAAQMRAFKTVKNTGIAVILDCGELDNIHPVDKLPVGERLCLQAQKLFYGMDVSAFGPMYRSHIFRDGGIEISFDYAEEGFDFKGEPTGFEIAGSDGEYKTADIKAENGKIFISSSEVEEPKFARYNYFNFAEVTIFGKNGIPLAPFEI
ncbi:MAG: sialate O-acetylesterase [Ruminococcus sp.]|nr:sialate O-acetylesterase [Ruminococcus sp.]